MSRSRRRTRFRLGHRPGTPLPPLAELKPRFETVAEPWSDPAIAPVLPLEGLSQWEAIRLPALALEEPPAEAEFVPTSNDPFQLAFETVVAEELDGEYDEDEDPGDEAEPLAEEPVLEALAAPRFELAADDDARGDATEPRDSADEPETAAAAAADVPAPEPLTAEQLAAEADLEAVAELELLTEAAHADTRLAAVAADLIARALEESAEAPAAEPAAVAHVAIAPGEPEPPPPPPPPPEPEPDPIELLFAEAQRAAQAGNADEAKALYRQLLAQRPLHVRARNNLALLLDSAGDHNGALAELDRALDVDQDNVTLLVNRGALLGQLGRFQAAERDLKRVLRVDAAHAEALFNLGVVMTKKGLWAEAVPALKRAIELEDGRAAAHFYLGEALNHVDDLPGAMLSYQRAAELLPGYSRALYGLGIVYDRMGRPDDAAQMYRRSREVAQPPRR